MMIKYRTFYPFVALVAICAGLMMFGGCSSDPSPLGEASDADDPQTLTLTDQERADLAQDYLFAKLPKEERKRILHTVGSLTPEHSALFFDYLRDLQLDLAEKNGVVLDEDTKVMLEMSKVISDFALKQGTNRLRLTKEGFNEALAEHYNLTASQLAHLNEPVESGTSDPIANEGSGLGVAQQASCSIGYAACSTTTFPSTNYGGSCGFGCINGSTYDRVSNEACEFGACDHRIFYPSAALESVVDGETSAADCVINYYGGIISRWQSGYTQLGYGIAGPASCGILFSVSEYLRDNTQVY